MLFLSLPTLADRRDTETRPVEESLRTHTAILRINRGVNERNVGRKERANSFFAQKSPREPEFRRLSRENEILPDYDVSKLVHPESQHKVPRLRRFVTESNRERIRLSCGFHSGR